MSVRYYDWTHEHGADEPMPPLLWYLDLPLKPQDELDLRRGKYFAHWDADTTALYDDEVERTDFPVTSNDLPVYSPHLIDLMKQVGVDEIQYLPIRIAHRQMQHEITGYHIANYLRVIDCLDRSRSDYQVWTKENLLFWDKRPWMLGTFRDVRKPILDATKIGGIPVFRLWGWEAMVLIRSDIKHAIEDAGITGCRFTEVDVSS